MIETIKTAAAIGRVMSSNLFFFDFCSELLIESGSLSCMNGSEWVNWLSAENKEEAVIEIEENFVVELESFVKKSE